MTASLETVRAERNTAGGSFPGLHRLPYDSSVQRRVHLRAPPLRRTFRSRDPRPSIRARAYYYLENHSKDQNPPNWNMLSI